MTIQQQQTAEHRDYRTEGLYPGAVGAQEVVSTRRQGETIQDYVRRLYRLPRRSSQVAKEPPLVSAPGTIENFFERLKNRLATYGINYDALPKVSSPAVPPPCFRLVGASYREWLKHASDSPPAVRYDMPGEPNYCQDCTAQFKLRAQAAKACGFPGTRFEQVVSLGEKDVVGTSRSVGTTPTDQEIDYIGMKVPVEAIEERLRAYIKTMGYRKVGIAEWRKMPPAVRDGITCRDATLAKGEQ